MPKCSIHPDSELTCPACLGARGGAKMSPRKLAALIRNAKLPRPRARKTKPTL